MLPAGFVPVRAPLQDPIALEHERRLLRDPRFKEALERETLPQISQYLGSPNDEINCGPASLAMVASHYGRTLGLSRPRLVGHLARWAQTDARIGTKPALIGAAAGGLGLGARLLGPKSVDEVVQALRGEKKVIALGNYAALPVHFEEDSPVVPHYVALSGMVGERFVLNDPATPDDIPRLLTREQLNSFLAMHDSKLIVVGPQPG
jgi:hypothetical protein